jgi:hypothetical protein
MTKRMKSHAGFLSLEGTKEDKETKEILIVLP